MGFFGRGSDGGGGHKVPTTYILRTTYALKPKLGTNNIHHNRSIFQKKFQKNCQGLIMASSIKIN